MARGDRIDFTDNIVFICTNKKCAAFMTIWGISLLLGGIIGLIVSPIATKQQVQSRVPLTENGFAATQWIDPPFNLTMQLWLFNTTNSDEILRGTFKPSVAQKGPYTYIQKNQKNQVVYGKNDNVSYIETNVFYFDQSRSCADCFETDVFTVPNAIYTSIVDKFRYKDEDYKRALNLALMILAERPFVTKTVNELLFQGFEDQVLNLANSLSHLVPNISKLGLPKIFSYFPKNNTNDGRYEICVGGNDVKQMGSILSWNGNNTLTWWNTSEANEIKGTDAQLFPPYLQRDQLLPIFVSDMCRSAYLRYSANTYQDGLQIYRFIMPPETFNTSYPGNEGFCRKTDRYFPSQPNNTLSCLPPGLLDLSSCRGSPIVLSMPHFLFAAEEVIKSIDGIKPTSDHQSTWDIQPTFGASVAVNVKLQINVPLYPDNIFLSVKQVKPSIIPLFWFNASAHIDPGTRDYLYYNIIILQTVGYAATFAVFVFGLIILTTLIACCCRYRLKSKRIQENGGRDNSHVNRALIEDEGTLTGSRPATKNQRNNY